MTRQLAAMTGALLITLGASSASAQYGALGKWFDPPDAKIFIEQHGVFTPIQEPDFHMAAARRNYEAGNHWAASDEVERAAGGVAYMEERATGKRKRDLRNAERELRDLMHSLRRREVESVDTLNRVFRITDAAMLQPKD